MKVLNVLSKNYSMSLVDIYCATSPSGKKYVGQAVQFLSSGKKWGYKLRWKQHINEAKNNKQYCAALENAIIKYGGKLFTLELLESVDKLKSAPFPLR